MLKYLLRQPLNTWRTLGWFHKIEIILLVGLIYIVTIGKLFKLYNDWLGYDWVTSSGLAEIITHIYILSFFLTGPFILIYLLPRQSGLLSFYSKPLSINQLFQATGYYYFKYQAITIIFYLVFLSAMFGINWKIASISACFILICGLIVFIFQFKLFIEKKTITAFWLMIIVIFIIYHIAFALFSWYIKLPWLFDCIILTVAGIYLWKNWPLEGSTHLELIFPQKSHWQKSRQSSRIDYAQIPRLLPVKIQALFNKELLGLWRNSSYRKLKWITFFIYIILIVIIVLSQFENKDIFLILLTGFTIWLHYSNYFNEKYVQPEPDWYFHTVPFRFHHLWISKFLVEFIYILIIITGFWISLLIADFTFSEQLNLVILILGFSIIVLSIMINFQIMFYDDPRLAGYAYHFTIIFLLIMSANYRLVGPLISIILLTFYFYKSYRYFKS